MQAKEAARVYKASKTKALKLCHDGRASLLQSEDPQDDQPISQSERQKFDPGSGRNDSSGFPKVTPFQRLAKRLWGRPIDGASLPTKGDNALRQLRRKCPEIRTAIAHCGYSRPEGELISAKEAVYYMASVRSEARTEDEDAVLPESESVPGVRRKFEGSRFSKSIRGKQGKVPLLNLADMKRDDTDGYGRALTEPHSRSDSLTHQHSWTSRQPTTMQGGLRLLRGQNVTDPIECLVQPSATSVTTTRSGSSSNSDLRHFETHRNSNTVIPADGSVQTQPSLADIGFESGDMRTVMLVRGVQDSNELSIEDSMRYIFRGYPVLMIAVYEGLDRTADVTIRFEEEEAADSAVELARELGFVSTTCTEQESRAMHKSFKEEQHVTNTWTTNDPRLHRAVNHLRTVEEHPRVLTTSFPSARRIHKSKPAAAKPGKASMLARRLESRDRKVADRTAKLWDEILPHIT